MEQHYASLVTIESIAKVAIFMEGWIRLYRQIQKCSIWDSNEPYDMRSAWLYLLLNANYKDGKVITKKKKLVSVERGQLLTTIRDLSAKWRWSKDKVSKFLSLLEADKMVTIDKDRSRTLITIVNYSFFQDCTDTSQDTNRTDIGHRPDGYRTDIGQISDTDRTQTGQPLYNNIYNNNCISKEEGKEIKEGKKVKREEDNKNTFCSEPEKSASEPQPKQTDESAKIPEQPVISLTLNDNSEYGIFQKDIDEWSELYPSVDVMQELRNMKGWCKEHKANRKTRRGVRIFINSWLSREQNKGGKRTMSGVEAFINGRK